MRRRLPEFFFLLVMFLLLSSLMHAPGVKIKLPVAADLPGTEGPMLAVAVDSSGKFYFENQLISESELSKRLSDAAKKTSRPLTLVIQADKAVRNDTLIHLTLLARDAGIYEATLATLPKPFSETSAKAAP